MAKHVPKTHLMTETEWRNLGVQQSPGWVHYLMHSPGKKLSNNLKQYKIIANNIFLQLLFVFCFSVKLKLQEQS